MSPSLRGLSLTPGSDTFPLSAHLRCGQDTLHGPALLLHRAVHAAKTGPGASLALVAGGLARCLLACGRPVFREGTSE